MITLDELSRLLPLLESDRIEKTVSTNDKDKLSEKRSSFAKTFDILPCFGSTLSDLDLETFKLVYLPRAIDKETLEANHRQQKEQLASLKFFDLKADCPTNLGILIFGKNPSFYLPGAYIQYVRFSGPNLSSPFEFEHQFKANLLEEMKVIELFIESQISKKVLPALGANYHYKYQPEAIKELLYNAIIHRDYQSNAPIKFYEFSDHILIQNSGGLYGEASADNFPNKNDYRNPGIAEVAKNMGYINRFNVGVRRSIDLLVANGNPEPVFDLKQSAYFEVQIFKRP